MKIMIIIPLVITILGCVQQLPPNHGPLASNIQHNSFGPSYEGYCGPVGLRKLLYENAMQRGDIDHLDADWRAFIDAFDEGEKAVVQAAFIGYSPQQIENIYNSQGPRCVTPGSVKIMNGILTATDASTGRAIRLDIKTAAAMYGWVAPD